MSKRPHTLTTKSIVILIIVSVMVLLLTGTGVYAAYTNSRHAQRTIAAYDATGARFSSNDLGAGDSRDSVKTIYTTDVSHDPGTVVTVCNYERGKQTRPNESDVTYTLTARLVRYDPGEAARYVPVDAAYITANDLSAYTVTIRRGLTTVTLGGATLSSNALGGTLTGGAAQSDAYTVTMAAAFASVKPNLYLEMIATPTDESLPVLRGIFKADMRSEGATNAWTGSFNDSTVYTPAQYDGFNYLVTGVGAGTCMLHWNTAKVTMSDDSLSRLAAISGAVVTNGTVTFAVDSDVEARYDLQFYKVAIGAETWSDMNTTVVWLEFNA